MAMKLTAEEQDMLNGKYGEAVKKAIDLQVQMGELYGAEYMIPIHSVHMPGVSATVTGEPACEFIEMMRDKGGKFRVLTTLNTVAVDMDRWKELGFEQSSYDFQKRIIDAYTDMGAVTVNSCTPFFCGNLPRKGESVAWGESSAVAFCNSVLGARTNREGGPMTLAAALTGRVAAFGYHLDENRRGHMLFKLEEGWVPKSFYEYGALGHYIGKQVGSKIPVIDGIPKDIGLDNLRILAAALATGGAVALFHVVGVTPEADTLEAAFGGRTPEKVVTVGKAEMEAGARILDKHGDQEIGLVALGCPHASIDQVQRYAEFLKGKKVREGLELWIMVAHAVRETAERNGWRQTIEESGAWMTVDTCPQLGTFRDIVKNRNLVTFKDLEDPDAGKGRKVMLTNSAKLAHYVPGQWDVPTYFRETMDCLKYAVGELDKV